MRTNNIIERMDATMNTELITKKWNYDESVKMIAPKIMKLKTLTIEIYAELWLARKQLSNPGARNDLTLNKSIQGWNQYCLDIGVQRQTVNNWLERYDAKNRKLIDIPKPKKETKPEPQLGPEWYDNEMIEFWKEYETEHRADPKPEGTRTIFIDKISVPDSVLSKISINGEIVRFRWVMHELEHKRFTELHESGSITGEDILHWASTMKLQADDSNYSRLHILKTLVDEEMKKGNFENIEAHMQDIQECVEHLNKRNPFRLEAGYKELPIDKLVPLVDSRIIIENKERIDE